MLQKEILEQQTQTKTEDSMQHDFATIAAQTDIPQVGAARRYAMKK